MLGEHGGFILFAYLATLIAVGGMTFIVIADYRGQVRKLKALEETGVTRRSQRSAPDDRPEWDTG